MGRLKFAYLGFAALVATFVATSSCTGTSDDCETHRSCSAEARGGSNGSNGDAGETNAGNSGGKAGAGRSGSTSGGKSVSGGPSTEGGLGGAEGGAAGAPIVLPCDGACTGDKPVCKASTETCVECLQQSDCNTTQKTKCDTATNACVECLGSADCTDANAAKCSDSACVKCTSNDDCAHIAAKNVCDTKAGECVQCTGKDASACGTDMGTPLVCDTLSRTCTTKKEKSAGLCQACVSDQQCKAGQLCVKETFGAQPKDVGYFCFWKKGAPDGGAPALCSAARPYVKTLANQTSIDGATGDVCGLAASTCTSVAQFRSKDCSSSMTPDDQKCGFAPAMDSKCGQFDVDTYRCTMICGSDDDCPVGFPCDKSGSPFVCQL